MFSFIWNYFISTLFPTDFGPFPLSLSLSISFHTHVHSSFVLKTKNYTLEFNCIKKHLNYIHAYDYSIGRTSSIGRFLTGNLPKSPRKPFVFCQKIVRYWKICQSCKRTLIRTKKRWPFSRLFCEVLCEFFMRWCVLLIYCAI